MKLLCINNKVIVKETSTEIIAAQGEDLIEGKIYETRGKAFKDEDGDLCYYITGVGTRLCCRFTELLDDKVEKTTISKLIEEFQLN